MNEQDGAQGSTKQRRSRKTSTANQENGKQAPAAQRPANNDKEAWKQYWVKVQPPEWFKAWEYWRTEPEIDKERQDYLKQRLRIKVSATEGIEPFKGVKLSRADIEWLLANHNYDGKKGPVRLGKDQFVGHVGWKGLHLIGADLTEVDLSYLPLAGTMFGFVWAHLSDVVTVTGEDINIPPTILHAANLSGSDLRASDFSQVDAVEADFSYAKLDLAIFSNARLPGSDFSHSKLEKAKFDNAVLQGTNFTEASLEGASFDGAHLGGVYYEGKRLCQGAIFREAFFSNTTSFKSVDLGDPYNGAASFVDAYWNGANITGMNWSSLRLLGDEEYARDRFQRDDRNRLKTKDEKEKAFQDALRANRQVSAILKNQGMNQVADHFAYRAQVLQRKVLWHQMFARQKQEKEKQLGFIRIWRWLASLGLSVRKFGSYLFSLFLDFLAGYGYWPGRIVGWYLLVIIGFAITYSVLGHLPLLPDTLVFSLMSFHGRGFFPSLSGETALHDPLVVFAAVEAVGGLLIEISFVATFTQRYFGK